MKPNWIARVALGLGAVVLVLFGHWLGGYDFNERGAQAVGVMVMAIGLFLAGVTCPLFDGDTK